MPARVTCAPIGVWGHMYFIDWFVVESYNDNGPHREVILLPKELRVGNLYCMHDAILSHSENVQ